MSNYPSADDIKAIKAQEAAELKRLQQPAAIKKPARPEVSPGPGCLDTLFGWLPRIVTAIVCLAGLISGVQVVINLDSTAPAATRPYVESPWPTAAWTATATLWPTEVRPTAAPEPFAFWPDFGEAAPGLAVSTQAAPAPLPTYTPQPTYTPAHTQTPAATYTLQPTYTPWPTAVIVPSPLPAATIAVSEAGGGMAAWDLVIGFLIGGLFVAGAVLLFISMWAIRKPTQPMPWPVFLPHPPAALPPLFPYPTDEELPLRPSAPVQTPVSPVTPVQNTGANTGATTRGEIGAVNSRSSVGVGGRAEAITVLVQPDESEEVDEGLMRELCEIWMGLEKPSFNGVIAEKWGPDGKNSIRLALTRRAINWGREQGIVYPIRLRRPVTT